MLADSHCHLQLIDYEKLGQDMVATVQHARDNGVEYLLCVATHLDQAPELQAIADKFANVKTSVGLHPNDEVDQEPTIDDFLAAQAHHSVVAIGETGLDYYRTTENLGRQQDRFRVHIRAAKQSDKPLIVHTREAKQDTLNILREEHADTVGGVLHCFTEDLDMALQALELNFYISFSGIITFKNAVQIQHVAQNIPLDKILIETDCPFLAPDPLRGHINQPVNVKYVAEYIAKLRGEDFETVAEQTTKNYKKLFKIL